MQKLLDSLNGNKTYLGILSWVATNVAAYLDKLNPAQADLASKMSWGLIGLGLVHKLVKAVPAAR